MSESLPWIIVFFVVLACYLYVRSRRINKEKKK